MDPSARNKDDFDEGRDRAPVILGSSAESASASWAWPDLEHFRQSASKRRDGIGGSDATIILSRDGERIRQLWLEKRGEAQPPDLSDNLAVMLGCWSEAFNRLWFQKVTGKRVTDSGKQFACDRYKWRRCTVDGLVGGGAVWEAKHTGAFAKPDDVLERYMPQLQHNMAVTGCKQATLSVLFGNQRFEVFEIGSDWMYQITLFEAEENFWNCVLTGKEPVSVAPPPPPRPIGTREVCFEGNNCWASAAVDWLNHKEAAKLHAAACSLIKAQIEDDVSRAFGHGIEAKRNKGGAITIKELTP